MLGWVCPTPWAFLPLGSLEGVGSPICRFFFPSLKKPAQSAFVKVMFPPTFRFRENHAQMGLPHTVGILAAGVPRRGRKSYLPSFFTEFEKARPIGFRKGNVSTNFQISRKSCSDGFAPHRGHSCLWGHSKGSEVLFAEFVFRV